LCGVVVCKSDNEFCVFDKTEKVSYRVKHAPIRETVQQGDGYLSYPVVAFSEISSSDEESLESLICVINTATNNIYTEAIETILTDVEKLTQEANSASEVCDHINAAKQDFQYVLQKKLVSLYGLAKQVKDEPNTSENKGSVAQRLRNVFQYIEHVANLSAKLRTITSQISESRKVLSSLEKNMNTYIHRLAGMRTDLGAKEDIAGSLEELRSFEVDEDIMKVFTRYTEDGTADLKPVAE
jgi:DNA repair exonuclease SbcCD ATPase subunit